MGRATHPMRKPALRMSHCSTMNSGIPKAAGIIMPYPSTSAWREEEVVAVAVLILVVDFAAWDEGVVEMFRSDDDGEGKIP